MFVVGYQPSLENFSRFLKTNWATLENLKPISHEDGYFLVNVIRKMMLYLLFVGKIP